MSVLLTDFIARLAVTCGLAKPTIALLTAIVAGNFCAVLLYLHSRVVREEKWVRLLGFAFGLFTLQYLLQFADKISGWKPLISNQQLAQVLCSPANNLCILVAARILLRRSNMMPVQYFVLALVTSILDIQQDGLAARLPDALFSLYCLSYLGWAFYRNLSRKRPRLAQTNGILPVLYGLLNVVYAFNPVLVSRWPALGAGGATPLMSLDALVFATAFVFKVALFVSTLLLMIKSLTALAPDLSRGLLKSITNHRGRYLRPQGILKALAESADADLAALCIRSAGSEQDLWLRWLRDPPSGVKRSSSTLMQLPPPDRSVVSWVMKTGQPEVIFPDLLADWESDRLLGTFRYGRQRRAERDRQLDIQRRYFAFTPGMRSFVTVPILYHGGAVGCLNIEWRQPNGYSATAVQRIHHIAAELAPAVYMRRQIIAIDTLLARLRSAQMQVPGLSAEEALQRRVAELHRVLSTFAVVCLVELGFRWLRIGQNDARGTIHSSSSDDDSNLRDKIRSIAGLSEREAHRFCLGKLVAQADEEKEVGKLALIVSRHNDPAGRPSIVIGKLYSRIVAAMMAEAVLDVVRTELHSILNGMLKALNTVALSTGQAWFTEVETAARAAGLLWAVATDLPRSISPQVSLGGANEIQLVEPLRGQLTSAETINHLQVGDAAISTRHVIALRLEKCTVWLGVGRRQFGRELRFSSPWRNFLERAAQIADSALIRIERQALQIKAKNIETVAKRVTTQGIMVHTLRNNTQVVVMKTVTLADGARPGDSLTQAFVDRIVDLRKSAEQLRSLTTAFEGDLPSDARAEVPLCDAMVQITLLYKELLRTKEIELHSDIPVDLVVGVPLDTAFVALSTLIQNAAEEIRKHGKIAVTATHELDARGRVVCLVTDSGGGIPAHRQHLIFTLIESSKHSGPSQGLWLTRDLLQQRGGDLELKDGSPGRTTFALYFPAARRVTT